jgi:hypothetical protein
MKRSIRRRRLVVLVVVLPLLGLLAFVAAVPASASGGETGLITITPATPASEPSGAPTSYSVAVSCEGTAGASCGGLTASTITIPLVGPADMNTWGYSAVAGTNGLITGGPTVVSNGTGGWNLVLTLDSTTFDSGYSGTINLYVTPPDNTTPDHTTWSLTPTLSGGNIASVTAPSPATGEAIAPPRCLSSPRSPLTAAVSTWPGPTSPTTST